MKSMSKRLLGIAAIACASSVQATIIDLSPGTGNFGSANGAVFSNPANVTIVGTGLIDPFLRIQNNGTESGFNTNGAVSLDTKPGTWTHAIQLGQIATVTGDGTNGTVSGTVYRQFYLDINQTRANPLLSLDILQIRVGNSATPATFAAAGGLVFDLDTGADGNSTVLMDYSLFNGSGNGLDVGILIPNSVFVGKSAVDYVTVFASFGNTAGYGSNDGFEEFSTKICIGTNGCGGGPGGPPNAIPVPGTLLLLGLGLFGVGVARRRV